MPNRSDYTNAFQGEYRDLRLRLNALEGLLKCPPEGVSPTLIKMQFNAMTQYLGCLATRAEIEGIEV